MLKTRRTRLLAIGLILSERRPPATAMLLREQLEKEFPERYKRYDKWYRQWNTFKIFLSKNINKKGAHT